MSQTVHFQGNPVSVQGTIPQAGAKAQPFTLVAKDLSDVALSQYAGCMLCGGNGRVIQEDIDAWNNPISKMRRQI